MTGINRFKLPSLPTTTVVPENDYLFIPYLNRLYEEIAFTVNSKDPKFFTIPVTNTATDIPNLPTFGSFIVAVSGETSGLPCLSVALCKADSGIAGTVVPLTSQAGTVAPWGGATLTITSTATNYQINHSVAATTGNFNIRILGTQ